MRRIKSSTGRVYHLQDVASHSSYPLCAKYLPRSGTEILTPKQAVGYTLCKACDKTLVRRIEGLTTFLSEGNAPSLPKREKSRTKFDEFLADLEDLTNEYGEEDTIFGTQILALKKRYRKA